MLMHKEWHAPVLGGVTSLSGWILVVTAGHEFLYKYVKELYAGYPHWEREGFLRNILIDRTNITFPVQGPGSYAY